MALKQHMDNPAIAEEFNLVKDILPGADQGWLNDARMRAMAEFEKAGIPGPMLEDWKYTSLNFLANENYPIFSRTAQNTVQNTKVREIYNRTILDVKSCSVLVFVNGYIDAELSRFDDIPGVELGIFSQKPDSFKNALTTPAITGPLDNLNRAMLTDGYVINIAADAQLKVPVQIIHIATSNTNMTSQRTRCQINMGKGAKAEIVETFTGVEGERYWSHAISDVNLAEKADLTIYQLQLQGRQAIHMTELQSNVAKSAKFCHVNLQLGAELSRTELSNTLSGEDAAVQLSGAYLGRVKQSHDIVTRVFHDKPTGKSDQLFRGVLDKGGRSAYQGKVVVAQHAQKTNADQSCKNLLLDRNAEANAKPELLIYADDVKCSHGATVGELDPDQLFYLRSRGLPKPDAKAILVEAFISEVFDGLKNQVMADHFRQKAVIWLAEGQRS